MHVGVTRHVVQLINESARRGRKETIRPGRMNGDIAEKRIPLCPDNQGREEHEHIQNIIIIVIVMTVVLSR